MSFPPDLRLVRLLHLASPALPVGAYSYSQGLEAAAAAGIVTDAASASRWIGDALEFSIGRFDAPLLLRLMDAWRELDGEAVRYWNVVLLAGRETSEIRAETLQMGFSLRKLLLDLKIADDRSLAEFERLDGITFAAAFAFAAAAWRSRLAAARTPRSARTRPSTSKPWRG